MHRNLPVIVLIAGFVGLSGLAPALADRDGGDDAGGSVLTLSRAIEIAVENNVRVKAAEEERKGAVEESRSARADLFPKLSAGYSATSLSETPVMKNGPITMQVADRSQVHWDVTMVQPLFTGFALSSRCDMAKLEADIEEQEKRQTVLDLARDVKSAYFNALLLRKMVLVAEGAVRSLESHERNARKFYDQELMPYNDLLKSQVALANAIQDRERARASSEMATSDLNILLDHPIDETARLEDISHAPPFRDEFRALVEEAMEKRPTLKSLRLGLENMDNAMRLAKSAYYPTVALVGRYEQSGDDPAATNNDFANQHNASVTIEANWTFFEWGKTRAETAKVRHARRALLNRLKGAEDHVKLETKNAWLNLQVARNNIQTAKKALVQAKENFRITDLQYRQQVTTSTEVLDARTYLTQADANYYRALYGYMISLGELERAVGRK